MEYMRENLKFQIYRGDQVMKETISPEFSGLLYPPSSENGVYLLMGLLWEHLPYRFAFEEFEVDPNRQGYNHSKWLDARGKVWVDGNWKDVTFEFKLFSSGLRKDVEKQPNLYTDFLICWEHDAPDVEKYVDEVISLKEIFYTLTEKQRHQIILHPEKLVKTSTSAALIDDLLKRFSEANREKVRYFLNRWPQAQGATTEILFLRGKRTVFRACAYSSEHLIVSEPIPEAIRQELVNRFGGTELKTSIRVPLNSLTPDDLSNFVLIVNRIDNQQYI